MRCAKDSAAVDAGPIVCHHHSVTRRIGILAILLSLAMVAAAQARVAAHGRQKLAVERAVGFPRYNGPPPLACEDVWISSKSRFWAILYYAGQEHGPCTRFGADGAVFLHHTGSRWHVVIADSGFICPEPIHLRGVPYSIERDLLGCH
jgi:hypothetical protein